MRIVHLSTSDSAGGAARAAHRLHSGLRRLGHESSMLVSKRGTFDGEIKAFKPTFEPTMRLRRAWRRRQIARDARRYPHLPGFDLFSDDRTPDGDAIVDQIPPCDLINLHWVAGFVDYQGFFDRYPKHIPLVWRLADMNALTGGCHYDSGCGRFAATCGHCPQLQRRHDTDLSRQIWTRKKASLARIGPGGMHLVATSQWIAAEARRSSLLGQFPVTVIPNGLDITDFAPRDKAFARDTLGIPREANVVLFLADSVDNRRKGFAFVREAMGNMPAGDNRFLLSLGVGRPELDGGVAGLHLGKISNDRLLSAIYSAADVYVIASLQESFGQTVIESMACGTPVVGFASGGIPDMVRPGITGFLAPTGDANALRDALLRAIREPPASRRAMSENCRRIAVAEYSLDVQASAYARLYESLVAAARSTAAQNGGQG